MPGTWENFSKCEFLPLFQEAGALELRGVRPGTVSFLTQRKTESFRVGSKVSTKGRRRSEETDSEEVEGETHCVAGEPELDPGAESAGDRLPAQPAPIQEQSC